MNFNKAIVLGRLTRDPEQRALPSGQAVVNFSIATSRFYKDNSGAKQTSTDFHNIVAFGKLADICARYLKKGGLVLVEGRIQTRSWQDKDNNRRSRTEIVMESMQLGPKSGAGSFSQPSAASAQKPSPADDIPVIDHETPVADEPEEINVDNIPF
ncbi:MAG: Single-stranded DNA-binding protein [Parcubacteria group bacterium GW2011_GWF2_39_13b]|nr:MAG: Single-stranded DNA-binding protein [Parcubacteria group bacterium GW2011_GWF2_39_13b]